MPSVSPFQGPEPHDGSSLFAATSITTYYGSNQERVINAQYILPLVVKVESGGVPLAGEIVWFTPEATGPSVVFEGGNPGQAVTDVNGIAASPPFTANSQFTASITGYNVTVTAQPNSNLALTAQFDLNNMNIGAAPLVGAVAITAGEGQVAIQNSTFAQSLTAVYYSQYGAVLAGVAAEAKLFDRPTGTVFQENLSNEIEGLTGSGISGWTLLGPKTGSGTGKFTCRFQVANDGIGGRGQSSAHLEVVNAGVPSALIKVSGDGQLTDLSTSFVFALKAKLVNGAGTAMPGVSVTFTSPASGADCTFSGLNAYTANTLADGTITTPIPVANAIVGTYAITVTSAGVPAITFSLTNAVVAPPEDLHATQFCEA